MTARITLMETEAEHSTVSHKCLLIFSTKGNELVYLACVLCFILVDEIHHKESETHINTLFRKTYPLYIHMQKPTPTDANHKTTEKTWSVSITIFYFFLCMYFLYLDSCFLNWQSEYMSNSHWCLCFEGYYWLSQTDYSRTCSKIQPQSPQFY